MVDNEYRTAGNSYVFPNITETDSAYASGDGIEYYCTATNDFGIIRSRTVKAFYAGVYNVCVRVRVVCVCVCLFLQKLTN